MYEAIKADEVERLREMCEEVGRAAPCSGGISQIYFDIEEGDQEIMNLP